MQRNTEWQKRPFAITLTVNISTVGSNVTMERCTHWQIDPIGLIAIQISTQKPSWNWSVICVAEILIQVWLYYGLNCVNGVTADRYPAYIEFSSEADKWRQNFQIPSISLNPTNKWNTPGQRIQIDVKFVLNACLVGEAAGQKFYQYTAIDEYSRFRILEAFEEHSTYSSAEFIKHVVNAFPYAIECVQTDNGLEFTNRLNARGTKRRLCLRRPFVI